MTERTPTNTWTAEWRERLLERIALLGFAQLDDYFDSRPGRGYEALARELGADIAPVQLVWMQLRECQSREQFLQRAADNLMRHIVERVARGWGRGVNAEYNIVSALTEWQVDIERSGHPLGTSNFTEAVIRALRAEVVIPDGWIPATRADRYISVAFQIALGMD